ncbi:4-oxalocrotonate decarboxylase [Mycobacterium sp. KBS0706]|uniref:2-keto-4-pentenoate hydratase n=1 Tax=Mycobacterium sp. KBS0706 TaxID=2578109 RepID=UPI00110F6E25|nr:4-oxalocrotonate decarboxylase [Mycobacterium sp. KBS0706]TSD86110.1 4-oxalocrotonate decarboxylase [Mycobacterium sp. KBS0706]
MLDAATRSKIVLDIEDVYRTRKQLPLLTRTYENIEVEDSYRIQEEFIARRVQQGIPVRGYKIGLTSKTMQELVNSKEPDFSAITEDLFFDENNPIEASRFITPFAEMEIAFVLNNRLEGPGILPVDVIRATDFVLPAIEICDFRVAYNPAMTIVDTVADLAACGGVILGANPRTLDQLELGKVKGAVYRDSVKETEGEASAVLGHPINAVAWLANKLAQFGVALDAGQTILSGSFVRAFPMRPGEQICCSFDQGLGDVMASIV